MKLRDYQSIIVSQGADILNTHGFVYLAMEVRTGKTLTSLSIAAETGAKRVLFLTKKKAISSIDNDYFNFGFDFDLVAINYESMHKIKGPFDFLILDEAHGMGAFPKPSKRAKMVKMFIDQYDPMVILLSGTPTPESYSQMYHQVYGIKRNPFWRYDNFYKFAKDYVNVKQRIFNGFSSNDYTDGRQSILDMMKRFTISYSQKEAGFKVDTREKVLEVTMSDRTYRIANRLKRDLVVEGKDEVILADTPVKLMMKLHQIYSGTVKFESGKKKVLDFSKSDFIYTMFVNNKIGIFYKFTAELEALKYVYGDKLCTTLEEFNGSDKSIALQIVSGREGISLKEADALVYYNIDFSATSYWQCRDRMTTKDRVKSDVYWIFAQGGIEHSIYKAVLSKKNYTLNHFKKLL
jgi:hypothetical protein